MDWPHRFPAAQTLRRRQTLMTLESILAYDGILIQCHDDPDADAIVSGYALLKYLGICTMENPQSWYTAGGGRSASRACV